MSLVIASIFIVTMSTAASTTFVEPSGSSLSRRRKRERKTPWLTDELEVIYGPAPHGIESCDLLVVDLFYENKLKGFAVSETSFVIFLLMASRRLDADPFLNSSTTKKAYTKTGLEWIEKDQWI